MIEREQNSGQPKPTQLFSRQKQPIKVRGFTVKWVQAVKVVIPNPGRIPGRCEGSAFAFSGFCFIDGRLSPLPSPTILVTLSRTLA
jgi:hypothetical protein